MISHPLILLFYAMTSMINAVVSVFHKKNTENNFFINNFEEKKSDRSFIEDQTENKALRYGSKPFSYSGCGTAAVFNAMLSLKSPVPLSEIIRYFEGHGASLYASFGTAPQSIFRFFKKRGLNVKKTANRNRFRTLAENSDIIVLTIMNDRHRIRNMLHTICIEHSAPDIFTVHNSHGRLEKYTGFNEMMSSLGDGDGKADGVYMIGIRK